MAVAPIPTPFEVLDLRLLGVRSLKALFEEEQRTWRTHLHWDYRLTTEMISRHINASSLPGYVALVHGEVAGYCFFVYEHHKGLLGDLYVRQACADLQPDASGENVQAILLRHALETLENSPTVRRIEAQMISFGEHTLDGPFAEAGFEAFPRLFMLRKLTGEDAGAPTNSAAREGWQVQPWREAWLDEVTELIVRAYRGHVDSRINDQYCTLEGARRFLQNIVYFPGCGIFQREFSLLAVEPASQQLAGTVMTSRVAPGVAHITQVCVEPSWQGRGVGRQLVEEAMRRLAAQQYNAVSLTVTTANEHAVRLYQQLGFEIIKEFSAYARDLPRPA